MELGANTEKFPEGTMLHFRVPVASLQESPDAERRLIKGAWIASVETPTGEVIKKDDVKLETVGGSGEHALEWLVQALRAFNRL